jgi:O-antigen polymerase
MSSKLTDIFLGLCFLGIFLLSGLLSFVVSGTIINPTQTPKTFVFLYGGIVIGSLFTLNCLCRKNDARFHIISIDIVAGLLFVFILVNRYFLQEMAGFSFRFYELMGLVLLYIMIRQTESKYIPWYFLAIILGGLLQAVYGNLQLYGYFPSLHRDFNITGGFFNPGPYAGYLGSVFPVALGLWLYRTRLLHGEARDGLEIKPSFFSSYSLWVYTGIVAGVAILLVLPAAQSRAGLLAVAAGSAYLLYRRYGGAEWLSLQLNTPLKKLVSVSLAVVILAGTFAGFYLIKQDSADGRMLIWKATALLIQEQPVTGLGFDRFQAGYMNAQAAYFMNHPGDPDAPLAADNRYAFNEFLQFAAEQGVIGLALLFLVGILIIRTKGQSNSIWLIISKAGILATVVFGLFSYPAQILPIKLNLVLFLAVVASFGKPIRIRAISIPEKVKPWLKGSLLVVVLAGAIAGILHLNELRNASKTWKLGLDLYNSGNIEQSLLAYERVEPVFNRKGDFLMNYGKALSMAGVHEKAIQVLNKAENHLNNTIIQTALGDSYKALERFDKSEQAYLLAGHMLPDRFYPKYLLATLYEETGRWDKAVSLAMELVSKEPKIESTAVHEIKQEMAMLLERATEMGVAE